MTPAQRLRQLLAEDGALLVPGAYNPLVARILALEDFPAIYAGGYAAAAAGHGLPDIGLVTMSEMTDHLSRITRAVSVPVIADADTGFGELTNTARTVREYERAGVAAVQIEDQVFPKRCGHMEGKKVINMNTMAQKVHAAVAARENPDTVIIARTDAIAVTGLDDAILRMKEYEAAGADVIFPDAPRSSEDMATIRAELKSPLVANMSEHGKTPLFSRDEIGELGYKIALYPSSTLFAAAQSARDIARILQEEGTTRDHLDQLMVFGELNENVLQLSLWQSEEERATS